MLKKIRSAARRFRAENEGLITVEFVIYMPFLLISFAAMYTFFDAFRQDNINLKASYTVSDLISRETNYINNDYLDSMYTLFGMLVRYDTDLSMRVSVVRWDEGDSRYYVDWSKVRGDDFVEWTDGTIQQAEANLPTMPDQERVIIVETRSQLYPAFNVGLSDLQIDNFVFTRPRFAPQIVFVDDTPNNQSHKDDSLDL